MQEQTKAMAAAGVLVAAGLCAVAARMALRSGSGPGRRERAYRLRYEVRFVPARPGGRVRVALPDNTAHCRIHRASYSHPHLAVDTVRRRGTGQREAVAVASGAAGEAAFEAAFELHVSKAFEPAAPKGKVVLSTAERSEYLRSEPNVRLRSPPVAQTLTALMKDGPGGAQLLGRIFDHVSARVAEARSGPSDAAGALAGGRGTALGKARAMVALCRAGRMPARVVRGFVLEEAQPAVPHAWVEVYVPKAWVPYDPSAGYARELPPNYLPVRRGGPIVRAFDTTRHDVRFSIQRLRSADSGPAALTGGASDILHLWRLPVGMQETLAILLLLPVGALITAVFRNIVGLQTFGTFAPSLLALSFLYADWQTGLVMLVGILAIGLAGRSLLGGLRLLMVPRLSVILTVVVLFTAFAVSALDYLALTSSARAVILPMVILTMLIERFHITSEEDGFRQAVRRLGVTLLVAGCCLLVLRWRQLGRLALTFPEAELFVVAALLLIGRYSGYRLAELVRFRDVRRAGTPGA